MRMYLKIRARMLELDYNQSDLAAITGHSQGTISNWLTGKSDIRRGDIPVLAKALEIPPEEIPMFFLPELFAQKGRGRGTVTEMKVVGE